jgi:hypothetical protein
MSLERLLETHPRALVVLGGGLLLGVTLLVGIQLPFPAYEKYLKLLFILLAGTGTSLFFLRRPHAGLMLVIFACLLVPFEVSLGNRGAGLNSRGFGWWTYFYFGGRRDNLSPGPVRFCWLLLR